MRSELVIVGIILIGVGIGLAVVGYNGMQQSSIEKTAGLIKDFTEALTGEKMPSLPKRDTTGPTVMMILGGLSFIIGLVMILKSGRKETYSAISEKSKFCSNCGKKLTVEDRFCPGCGREV
ncbi:MAG: zinc ribbon domain-containing protein [candidate division WOR-3 bacterium]